jgi:hypothetical protein
MTPGPASQSRKAARERGRADGSLVGLQRGRASGGQETAKVFSSPLLSRSIPFASDISSSHTLADVQGPLRS